MQTINYSTIILSFIVLLESGHQVHVRPGVLPSGRPGNRIRRRAKPDTISRGRLQRVHLGVRANGQR